MTVQAEETCVNIRTVKSFANENNESKKFLETNGRVL
jgi:ABC-type multidrug transport system fused ATPase/permease subunit